MQKYKKHTWGWIKEDGIRCNVDGKGTAVLPANIIGMWVNIYCYDEVNDYTFYHEIFLAEYKGLGGSWNERPLSMLLKTGFAQAYMLANTEAQALLFENEFIDLPFTEEKDSTSKFRYMQKWKCTKCDYSFYTKINDKPKIIDTIKSFFKFRTLMQCSNCNTNTAKKAGVVKKPIINNGG